MRGRPLELQGGRVRDDAEHGEDEHQHDERRREEPRRPPGGSGSRPWWSPFRCRATAGSRPSLGTTRRPPRAVQRTRVTEVDVTKARDATRRMTTPLVGEPTRVVACAAVRARRPTRPVRSTPSRPIAPGRVTDPLDRSTDQSIEEAGVGCRLVRHEGPRDEGRCPRTSDGPLTRPSTVDPVQAECSPVSVRVAVQGGHGHDTFWAQNPLRRRNPAPRRVAESAPISHARMSTRSSCDRARAPLMAQSQRSRGSNASLGPGVALFDGLSMARSHRSTLARQCDAEQAASKRDRWLRANDASKPRPSVREAAQAAHAAAGGSLK